MRKSLVALAVLASFGGAALAQSSVNLYGRLDASVGNENVNDVSTTKLFSGNLAPSVLGLRGTEDMGGGLKANFALEGTLTVDDGTVDGLRFQRASWVGLSGGFGEVRAGRMGSSYKDIFDLGVSNNLYDSEFTPTLIAQLPGIGAFVDRPSNVIRYDSPRFGGFTGSVSHAFDENVAPSTVNPTITSFNLRYASGPLDLGIGHQAEGNDDAALERNFTVLSAAYDFRSFRVSGQLQLSEQGDQFEDQDVSVGVIIPVGSSFDVSIGFATGESEINGVSQGEGSAISLGGTYRLSKRTTMYGGLINGEVEDGTGVVVLERRMLAFGVKHDF